MSGHRRWVSIGAASIVLVLASTGTPPAAAGTYGPRTITVSARDGAGVIQAPGRGCDDASGATPGAGAYWHYDYGSALASGAFSGIATTARVHVDLHSDQERFPNSAGLYGTSTQPVAFLQGEESHAALLNHRGAVKLRLSSGSCAEPSLAFDGEQFSGSGDWRVDTGSGAYRGISGAGTFKVTKGEVDPGADNTLDMTFDGTFMLPDPALQVTVVRSFWGGLGTDYLTRRVSVTYRITNTGPGDTFGARLTSTASPTTGVTPLGPTPQALFDLPAGGAALVTVRYQLALVGPCALVILNCSFTSALTVDMPDALDVGHTFARTVATKAPNLPPPL